MLVTLAADIGSGKLQALLLLTVWTASPSAHQRHPELTEQKIWQVFKAERPKLVPSAPSEGRQ